MPETSIGEITVEKTPAYFVSKTAPGRVRSLNSTIKLIVVVRNPITRAISDYTQAISKKKRNNLMPSFEEMVLCNDSSNTTGMKNGVNASWGAIRIGIYHRHIRRWLQHFPLHQIHFVDGERLITNPAAEIYAVERFLTVKPVVRESNFATDPLKGFPCVLRKDNTLHCLGKTKGRAHPHVRFDVIQKLEDFYRPQNEEFFKLINRSPLIDPKSLIWLNNATYPNKRIHGYRKHESDWVGSLGYVESGSREDDLRYHGEYHRYHINSVLYPLYSN
ncbi:Heparan sulfate glucosamine 3-O-sulfotransferase 3B1 [Dirofilaria immitis]